MTRANQIADVISVTVRLGSWSRHRAAILRTADDAYMEVNPAGRFAVHLFGHMHETVLRSTAAGGGNVIRQWQGNSLFGLEKFGEPPQIDRRHGYGTGRIEFNNDGAEIRHWPRRAIKDPLNGWRFRPDHDSCPLVESDSCTKPESLESKTGNSKPVVGSEAGSPNSHLSRLQELELKFKHALESFKGQPVVFLEPKLSKKREFNEENNELHLLMEKPRDTLIIAPPEFGLTCLGLHLQLEAFKERNFWLYIDAKQTKGRKISDLIDEESLHFDHKLVYCPVNKYS